LISRAASVVTILHQREEGFAKLIAVLTKQAVGESECDRINLSAPLPGRLRERARAGDYFIEGLLESSKRAMRFILLGRVMKDSLHLVACDAVGSRVGHGQSGLDGIGREERVGIGRRSAGQEFHAQGIDSLGGRHGSARRNHRGREG
jgi:hypothetical protein